MAQDAQDLPARIRLAQLLLEEGRHTDALPHFEAVVVASQFAGKRTLQRHQMVYAGLGERMGREVHALSIQAFTPDEWRAAGGAA